MQRRLHVRARAANVGVELTASPAKRVIGIDGSRATVERPTGTERYTIELLAAMAALEPPDNIRVYFNSKSAPVGVLFPGVAVPIPARRLWTLRTLSAEMWRNPPDVLFVPSHVVPPICPRSVVTVHDLGYLAEPGSHEPAHRKQLEWTTRWNCQAAAGVIAVSEGTKRDLVDRLGISPRKIQVIRHGVSDHFAPANPGEIEAVRATYGLPGRFILAVGTLHPRKNIVRLIQAFERVAATDAGIALVLAGGVGWHGEDVLDYARRSPFSSRIRHLGYVADAEMPALFSAATLTAFVSLYEGFGLPALESMACGTPVVAAQRSSLPEVCGDAAELVDPLDPQSIAAGLLNLIEFPDRRARLVELGHARAKTFSWQNCASETLALLRAIRDN